jgi:hypothetical protein
VQLASEFKLLEKLSNWQEVYRSKVSGIRILKLGFLDVSRRLDIENFTMMSLSSPTVVFEAITYVLGKFPGLSFSLGN